MWRAYEIRRRRRRGPRNGTGRAGARSINRAMRRGRDRIARAGGPEASAAEAAAVAVPGKG